MARHERGKKEEGKRRRKKKQFHGVPQNSCFQERVEHLCMPAACLPVNNIITKTLYFPRRQTDGRTAWTVDGGGGWWLVMVGHPPSQNATTPLYAALLPTFLPSLPFSACTHLHTHLHPVLLPCSAFCCLLCPYHLPPSLPLLSIS